MKWLTALIAALSGGRKPVMEKATVKTDQSGQGHKRVAICVGHSRIGDRGAESVGGVSEWVYNKEVARYLELELADLGILGDVIAHYPRQTYGGAIAWLAKHIKAKQYDAAIELHFNAASSAANGYEYLYCEASGSGLKLARSFVKAHGDHFPDSRNRGAKGIHRGGRGGTFLWRLPCPAVICEPFFGSNPNEWAHYNRKTWELAKCYASAIHEWFYG